MKAARVVKIARFASVKQKGSGGQSLCLCLLVLLTALALLAVPITASATLPSGWGYELISPIDTAGQSVGVIGAGLDGDHAWIGAPAPFSGEQVTGNSTTFAATRTSQGWRLQDLADPAQAHNLSALLLARSTDSQRAIVSICQFVGIGCFGTKSFQLVDSNGTRTTMLSTPAEEAPNIVGASDDASRMIISNPPTSPLLAQDTHTQGSGLYSSHNGVLEFLGLDPSGHPFPCGAVLANNRLTEAASFNFGNGFEQNGLSADAQTVIFESPDPDAGCPEPVDLYVRSGGQTVNISAPRNGNPDEGAVYAGNTRDGNTIYFVTASKLAASDTDSRTDIYAYDRLSDTVTPITHGAEIADSGAPGGKRVVVSPDGDYVYFVAGRAIGGQGTDGAKNLFRYHNATITHIATISQGSFFLGQGISSGFASVTTPDGRHLLFLSDAELTPGQPSGGRSQLFQYSADTNAITCTSCPPNGQPPTRDITTFASGPVANVDHRMQSDDGSTIVFNTRDALVPQDTNGALALDPYMWKNGKVYLLGNAQTPPNPSQIASQVFGVTPDGQAVYFSTTEGLTPGTNDSATKLYIARNDPLPPPAAASPACQGDACQGLPSPPPAPTPPAGLSSSTLGNLAAPIPTPVVKPPPPKPLTRAQKLAQALKRCHRQPKGRRRRCESQARRRFGAKRASRARSSR